MGDVTRGWVDVAINIVMSCDVRGAFGMMWLGDARLFAFGDFM